MTTDTLNSNLVQTLLAKGLSVDQVAEILNYTLSEMSKHMHSSPETISRLDALEKKTEGLDKVVTFVEQLMEDKEGWNWFVTKASSWWMFGRTVGTFVIAIVAVVVTLKGWWLTLIAWTVDSLNNQKL